MARAAHNLQFQEFGRWQVLGRVPGQRGMWLCQCACGQTTRELHEDALLEGGARSCGCDQKPRRKDLSGQRFHWLIVMHIVDVTPVRYLCRCRCGSERILQGNALVSGNTRSCGCQRGLNATKPRVTLHRWYGSLFVLERVLTRSRKHARYRCQCLCGRESTVLAFALLGGTVKSCGCRGRGKVHQQWFGRLYVCAPSETRANDGSRFWLCTCLCGQQLEVNAKLLWNGEARSCGCLRREIAAQLRRHPVEIAGVRYHSVQEAATHAHVTRKTITLWCKTGRAQYVDALAAS